MPYARVNGQKLHFEDSGGSGSAVLLAHGFMLDQSMFDQQVAALAPEFRVIRWDARGFGRTEFDGRPFTYWDLADDSIALLDYLGIERAVVGGMSQGGYAALRAGLKYPQRIKALVLISTQAGLDDEQKRELDRQMLETWATDGPSEPMLEAAAAVILGPKQISEPWVRKWREFSKHHLIEPGRTHLARDDIRARAGEITCPAFVIHGTADQTIPFKQGEELAQLLPGCKGLLKLEGAEHGATLSHAAQINGALLEFLRAYA